ncbi:MAG: glycosyltransferase family 2 protein [Campylobacteraceae bacterium]|jgi:glycosyltransferase involved in cell wall biosynthesis|nr:glycosyltransferase family 2 protein [Campylobacteraceae bacterium]
MTNVSVLILAKNEEHNISDCIKSCDFADEIVIIDDFSSDKTAEISQGLGAKVVQHAMNGDWGAQQNFALEQAKHEWILFLDADERVTEELASEIESAVEKDEKNAYLIRRKNRFHFNKVSHGVLRPDFVCRLMPKKGVRVEGFVHPAIITPYPNKKMKNFMIHYTYDNWHQYFNKMNNYSTLAAQKYMAQGKKCWFFRDVMLRPLWAFIKVYIMQGGFLDGKMGWILSVSHYAYTMNKYVKLYYLYKSNGKL